MKNVSNFFKNAIPYSMIMTLKFDITCWSENLIILKVAYVARSKYLDFVYEYIRLMLVQKGYILLYIEYGDI